MSQTILPPEPTRRRPPDQGSQLRPDAPEGDSAGDSSGSETDDSLVAAWIEEHGAAVRGYLRAMTGRGDVADDLWQEVFHRAWRARAGYEELGCARAFLVRIADRLLCDHARSQKRRAAREKQLSADGWKEIDPAADPRPPGHALEQGEAARELRAALDRLSTAQRRVLLLRYYGELSFAEIAALTERPLNTVLSDCRRALGALRKLLPDPNP